MKNEGQEGGRDECLCTNRELYIFAASCRAMSLPSLILLHFSFFLLLSYFLFFTIHFQFNINAFARFCHAFVRFSLSSAFGTRLFMSISILLKASSCLPRLGDERRVGIENANDSFLYTKAFLSLFDCEQLGESAGFVVIVLYASRVLRK